MTRPDPDEIDVLAENARLRTLAMSCAAAIVFGVLVLLTTVSLMINLLTPEEK